MLQVATPPQHRGFCARCMHVSQIRISSRDDEEGIPQTALREIGLLRALNHPNIVMLVGCTWEKELMSLIMEFCSLGTTSDVLKNKGELLTWEDPLLKWCVDMARAMKYLNRVVHDDPITGERKHGKARYEGGKICLFMLNV